MDPLAIAQLLQGAGWGASEISGHDVVVAPDGNCVEVFGWDIDTYHAALYAFIGTCVEIKLYWAKVCRSDHIGLNTEGMELPSKVIWVNMGLRTYEIDECKFDKAAEVEHDDLETL